MIRWTVTWTLTPDTLPRLGVLGVLAVPSSTSPAPATTGRGAFRSY
jgi:hypothetical protein